MPEKKPAARRRPAPKRAAQMSPLDFLKSVYREPIPDDVGPADRAKLIAQKLAAAKAAAAYELQQRQPDAGEGELAALLRELEGGDGDE